MTGTAQIEEEIGALESAARSLRDHAGRMTAALDGVASALDRERELDGESLWVEPVLAEDPPPAVAEIEPARPPAEEQAPEPRTDEATGQAELWAPGLLCALALFLSVALLKVGLALAIPIAIVAAVLLPMKSWMPALAAVALGLALAIESPGGSMADRVAAMCVAFVLIAGALLLYETWQRLHLRLQS